MPNTSTRSRSWWALASLAAIAGFFLFTEHSGHLFGLLPFVLLLACPFLHMFGRGGHGRHDDHRGDAQKAAKGARGQVGRVGDGQQASDAHQHASGATRDDWRG